MHILINRLLHPLQRQHLIQAHYNCRAIIWELPANRSAAQNQERDTRSWMMCEKLSENRNLQGKPFGTTRHIKSEWSLVIQPSGRKGGKRNRKNAYTRKGRRSGRHGVEGRWVGHGTVAAHGILRRRARDDPRLAHGVARRGAGDYPFTCPHGVSGSRVRDDPRLAANRVVRRRRR